MIINKLRFAILVTKIVLQRPHFNELKPLKDRKP